MEPKTGEEKSVVISMDEGVRPNTNLSDLAKLKPAFRKDGSTTAGIYVKLFANQLIFLMVFFIRNKVWHFALFLSSGNASQVSDGSGAVLLMKRSLALKKGLPILGVFRYEVYDFPEPYIFIVELKSMKIIELLRSVLY